MSDGCHGMCEISLGLERARESVGDGLQPTSDGHHPRRCDSHWFRGSCPSLLLWSLSVAIEALNAHHLQWGEDEIGPKWTNNLASCDALPWLLYKDLANCRAAGPLGVRMKKG